jgi:hypothetical protein
MAMLGNFSGILRSTHTAIVPVFHTIGMDSGFFRENNSFQIICIPCQPNQIKGRKIKAWHFVFFRY